MNYFEAFSEIKDTLEKAKIKSGVGHFAIQVCITDEDASGIFYIEDFGDKLLAEPYDYYDNDAEIIGQAQDLKLLFEKKLDLEDAIKNGVITANGNIEGLKVFLGRITKTTARKTVKSVTSKKGVAKKSTSKKMEVKKMTEDSKKVTKPKDTETVKEVVEKEIKPKK